MFVLITKNEIKKNTFLFQKYKDFAKSFMVIVAYSNNAVNNNLLLRIGNI